ncbi:hypothetical protein B0T16DRAFT_462580 [Cercophora newfieldiana]|uniref:F-box domain-containing protein n=1 Tax=Cercophora newfieldiana TaxID=92897 RepID=A0AA40CIL6_9PEZI|nr:hypothetical protein B0T16DRAFT_462580 [Cercophora newfieldiana]
MAFNTLQHPPEAEMRLKINEARSHIADEQYTRAVASIQAAVVACGCGSNDLHLGKRACNVAQCVRAVLSSENDALERVAGGPCTCGFAWPSCGQSLHAEAIDELAKCLEQAGRLAAAFSVALGLIRLNPYEPMGYCRAVRIARRLWSGAANLPPAVARERAVVAKDSGVSSGQPLGDLSKPLVRKGLHSVGKNSNRCRSQYDIILNKMAASLRMPEGLRDPMKELPREILTQIFSYMETPALIGCLFVSKTWAQVLTRDSVLWAQVILGRPGNPGRNLGSFLNRHSQDIKTFSVNNSRDFPLTPERVRYLMALPRLKRLHLSTSKPLTPQIYAEGMLNDLRGKSRLTHLRVSGISWTLVRELIACNGQTLQVLDITDQILIRWYDFSSLGLLPQVRKLRLVGSRTPRGGVTMDRIMSSCPKLRDLYVDGIELEPLHSTPNHEGWNDLRSIVLGQHTNLAPRLYVPFLYECTKLESIEILIPELTAHCEALFAVGTETDGSESVFDAGFNYDRLSFPRLKVFRCRSALHPTLLEHILSSAITSGVLQHLELSMGHSVYGSNTVTNPNANGNIIPMRDLTFTLSDNILTLGLHDFNWAPHDNSSGFDGAPFVDWVKQFPSVETVSIYPGAYSSAAMVSVVRPLLAFDNIKVINQDRLTGVDWDEVKKRAKARGKQINHIKDLVPPKWESFD